MSDDPTIMHRYGVSAIGIGGIPIVVNRFLRPDQWGIVDGRIHAGSERVIADLIEAANVFARSWRVRGNRMVRRTDFARRFQGGVTCVVLRGRL